MQTLTWSRAAVCMSPSWTVQDAKRECFKTLQLTVQSYLLLYAWTSGTVHRLAWLLRRRASVGCTLA